MTDDAAEILFGATMSPAPSHQPQGEVRDAADVLFGDTMQPSAALVDQPAGEERDAADVLFGEKEATTFEIEIPDAIRELRDADQSRAMFSPHLTYADSIPDSMLGEFDGISDLPEESQVAIIREAREMAADLGYSQADLTTIQRVERSIREAAPTDDVRADWREQAVQKLNQEFGMGAAQALRDAQALVARDPRLARVIDADGRGDHPDLILTFARLARRARAEGRLK